MKFIELLKKEKQYILATVALLVVLVLAFYSMFLAPPKDFKNDNLVIIPKGATLQEISNLLEKETVISSPIIFSRVVTILSGEGSVQAGSYYFNQPESAIRVAGRIIKGQRGLDPIRITVPEGYSRYEMVEVFNNLERFDVEKFLEITEGKEGYLFPDTYFFFPDVTEEDVALKMEETFKEKTFELTKEIEESGQSLEDIITMASIVEAEAHTFEDMRKIAGVLWKRIEIGMPLQVDVTFKYINGKTTFDLTHDDLRDDSPYNTYVHTGLPPTPISSPGLSAIEATLDYEETDYLFFLADSSGTVHYSRTFEEHKYKKSLYLR